MLRTRLCIPGRTTKAEPCRLPSSSPTVRSLRSSGTAGRSHSLATLSPESQALAQKLAQAKDAAPSSTGMHSWTDTQGRTLQAIFIKADATTVTLNWNGGIVPIPLASLNAVSQKLAKDLSSAGTKPVAAPDPKPKPTLKPTIVDGQLSLNAEHNWQSTDGNAITAKFISLEGEDVNLGLFSGRRESSVPLSRLSSDSQALAKKLHGIYQEKEKAALQAAKKKKVDEGSRTSRQCPR